jgi:hypothetical protein
VSLVTRELLPYDLSWAEVDPSLHPFDSEAALDAVRALEPASRVPVRPVRQRPSDRDEAYAEYGKLCDWAHTEGWEWAQAMTRALAGRYGRWSVGWRWAMDEGDLGGGPVGNWCCTLHSISTPEATLERVAASLCEWREWLEYLARWFDRYPLGTLPAESRRDAWERATTHLVLQTLDRTGSGDAWYGHCQQVLTWFLTRWGVDPEAARGQVEEAIGGRFGSWTTPERTVVDGVAERLAASLEADTEAPADAAEDPYGYTYTSARLHSYLDE